METLAEAPRKKQRISNADLRSLHDRTKVEQTVDTNEAAAIIGNAPQTLRRWACYGDGPIKPRRVGRQLRWPVAELKKLLGETTDTPSNSVAA